MQFRLLFNIQQAVLDTELQLEIHRRTITTELLVAEQARHVCGLALELISGNSWMNRLQLV